MIVDSHTVAKSNAETSCVFFTYFPLVLEIYSTPSQPKHGHYYSQMQNSFIPTGIPVALL